MLRRIGLTNFKCFENLDLPCAPLNLLCGLNGMGKSSVIQALLVLRQSAKTWDLQHGRLVLNGDLTNLGIGSDVLFEDAGDEVVGFTLHDDWSPQRAWTWRFGYSRRSEQLVATGTSQEDLALAVLNVSLFGECFVYLQADRTGPRTSYPVSEVRARCGDFGRRGEYAWDYLNDHERDSLSEDDPRCGNDGARRLRGAVDHWLQHVSPGAHLQLDSILEERIVRASFTFDHPDDVTSRRHRATNVGFGLSYAFPVVLALLSEPGTLCLIENPEAHLHPRGQTKLAELAARAAAAGVQIFAETHSDHFLDGVRLAIHDGLIAPADVAIHYFEREGGRTVVSSPSVDAAGRLSRWPAGFFDQHEENLARLLEPRS